MFTTSYIYAPHVVKIMIICELPWDTGLQLLYQIQYISSKITIYLNRIVYTKRCRALQILFYIAKKLSDNKRIWYNKQETCTVTQRFSPSFEANQYNISGIIWLYELDNIYGWFYILYRSRSHLYLANRFMSSAYANISSIQLDSHLQDIVWVLS